MDSVKLIECPRDAWQGLPGHIPAERKAEYLRALITAGFRHIDAVSFVSPKAVPQMADSEEVLALLGPTGGTEIIGIVVNERGAARAIATGAVTTLGFPFSISETFLRRNQNQSPEENRRMLEKIAALAKESGLQVVAYISMAFGNPYGDAWSEHAVAEAARIIASAGVESLSLADTVGSAQPELISRVVSAVITSVDGCEVGVHLHSTRVGAGAKVLAAYDAGCRRFDAALGGLGGCPFAQDDLVGNIPTEEVISAFAQRRIDLAGKDQLASLAGLNDALASAFGTVAPREN